jgi:hypothetical protein
MGTYTELLLKCRIVDGIPEDVNSILEFLFGSRRVTIPNPLPDHPFFRLQNWDAIGRSASYYHVPCTSNYYKAPYLFSRSDLKNYQNEIQAFLDWIMPYLNEPDGSCIGWICCERLPPFLIAKKSKNEWNEFTSMVSTLNQFKTDIQDFPMDDWLVVTSKTGKDAEGFPFGEVLCRDRHDLKNAIERTADPVITPHKERITHGF